MNARLKLSAVLIVANEDKVLARALASVAWCDEIVVVDARSTDRTREIALDPTASWQARLKWFERSWDGFKNQRNYALEQTTSDWVFCIDADEECTPELRARIESILSESDPFPYWKVRRQEFFLGRAIHYGVWNPSYQDRFFRKAGVWFVNEIHEYPKYPEAPRRIHEPLLHAPDFDPERFLTKMNKYTSVEARERVAAGRRTNVFRMVTAGPAMFLKNYFYYKSYRDGVHGLAISVLEGISRSVRHVKIWWLQREAK